MIHEVPVIQNQTDFPDIPASARMAIVIPTARWTPMSRSVIGSMIGVANEEICVLIADNSENEEKREFLKKIRNINPYVLAVSHAKNIGALNNFFYLYDWSRRIEFLAQMADDDWMSPTYFSDAYQVLRDNPRISCAEVGTTLVDMGDSKLVNVSQPSMYGRTPFERMQKWNGVVARVTMYNLSRRSSLEAALQFLRESPLPGMTLVENLWELNRLALGEFVASPGHGCLVHYPEYGSIQGDRNARFYNLLCKNVGLAFPALFFMGLSTAIQCAIFLRGNLSPIADPKQRRICSQFVFEHIFTKSFLPALTSGINKPEMAELLIRHPKVLDDLQEYCSPPFTLKPELNRELFDWFVKLLRIFESNRIDGKPCLSERFEKFADEREWELDIQNETLSEDTPLSFVDDTGQTSNPVVEAVGSATEERDLKPAGIDFYALWQQGHSYLKRDALWIAERMETLAYAPIYHLAVILPEGLQDRLGNNISALGHQFYPHWKLTIIATDAVHPTLLGNDKVAWIEAPAETHLAVANRALSEIQADWVGIWEAGDKLAPHALFSFADRTDRHPELQVLYSDEDVVDSADVHSTPFFKTDFNLEMLRAAPFVVGGLLLIRQELFVRLAGFDTAMEGVEALDLTLRAWESVGRAGIGHIADVLYHRYADGGHVQADAETVANRHRQAVSTHLARLGLAVQVEAGLLPGTLHMRYPVLGDPLVSILITTKNQVDFLKRCITSLVEITGWSNCEILILDNGSDEKDARDYLADLRALNSSRLRVLDCAGPFNFSAINNQGAREAQGEYLVLLNNDTAVLHPEWLEEMLGIAQQGDVGAVGAKLYYPDGTVQHAGAVLGMNDAPADYPFIHLPGDAPGYFGRTQLPQEYTAVTAACLLVRRDIYLEVGGLDETRFQVSYNDVDFCLRLTKRGLRNVFTPHARLLREESLSQSGTVENPAAEAKAARLAEEQNRFFDTWRHEVAFDPAYNRNLSMHGRDFLIEIAPPLTWDPEWRPRPRILAHPADRYGCGEYRVISPMRALNDAGRVMGWECSNYLSVPELFRMEPEVILLQRQASQRQLESVERYIRHSKAFRIYEIDDLITNIPVKSSRKKLFVEQKDLHKHFRKGVSLCHRFIVSTDFLAEQYRSYIDNIVVVPNYIERARWGDLNPARRYSTKPRVGWAGGGSHDGDLSIIFDVVKATAKEVDWVFLGMCPDAILPYVAEFQKGVSLDDYPAKLASLDLDLAVAPLEDVPFNHGKSHLRLLEYGVLGYPVICSDLTPYRGDYPVTRVNNRFKDWVDAIRSHVADRDELARRGDVLREYINANWILEDHLDIWQRAWLP